MAIAVITIVINSWLVRNLWNGVTAVVIAVVTTVITAIANSRLVRDLWNGIAVIVTVVVNSRLIRDL